MKDIEGEVITNAQNAARAPTDKPLEAANLALDDVEGFALKYGLKPAEVFVKFLGQDFEGCEILQEKQARLAWDWIKFNKAEEDGEDIDSVTFVIKHGSKN